MRPSGAVAEWLGRGLQSLVQRFDSARRLLAKHRNEPDPPRALLEEGVVRRLTSREIDQLMRPLLEEAEADVSGVGHAIVLKARTQVGVREKPKGSNRGVPLRRYVRWFEPGSPPMPWCAYFVSWCHDQVTDGDRLVPWGSPGQVRAIRKWRPHVQAPRHGDFFGHVDEHMGVVWQVDPAARTIRTVEGNYSDAVMAVERSWNGLWFVRP